MVLWTLKNCIRIEKLKNKRGNFMREQQIKEILLKKNFLYEENSTIWATILPNIGAYKQGLGETMYVMERSYFTF